MAEVEVVVAGNWGETENLFPLTGEEHTILIQGYPRLEYICDTHYLAGGRAFPHQ